MKTSLFIPNWDCPVIPNSWEPPGSKRACNTKNSDKLVIYNWGDYIDPELPTEFKRDREPGAIWYL